MRSSAARFELLDNYYLTPASRLCKALIDQTYPEDMATGIDEIAPAPALDGWEEADGASLSDDIIAVYYYDLQGRRIGYALPPGQPVIAHIILRNGASIVRKIVVQ